MTTENTTPVVETPVVVETPKANKPAPKAKKKAEKAAAPAKTEKKATKAESNGKPEKKTTAGRAKKDGLRSPQVRILVCLKKANKPLARKQISEKAPVDLAFLTEYVGAHDAEIRKANDAKHFPSLLSLGFVKAEQHDVDGKDVIQYVITAKGKAALEKAAAK